MRRRDLFRWALAMAGVLAVGAVLREQPPPPPPPPPKYEPRTTILFGPDLLT